jgi:hypothetical protein
MSMENPKTKPDYKKIVDSLIHSAAIGTAIYFFYNTTVNNNTLVENNTTPNEVTIIEDQPSAPSE